MHRKYFIGIVALAIASIVMVAINMWKEAHTPTPTIDMQMTQRPHSPFKSYISGVGVVEPNSENLFIGTPVNRLVDKIEVKVGQKVNAGDILFSLESRDLQADLFTYNVAYDNAVARLKKLEALPRIEDVQSAEAILKNAEIELAESKSQYERVQGLQGSQAISDEEINRRRFNYEQAQAKVLQRKADYEKTKAGAWQPDIEIERLQALQAKAKVQRIEADIERTIIRAPISGTVLQIKIHEGEYPTLDSSKAAPMILGNINPLHVRVSINQFDASFFRSDAPAVAFLQGNAKVEFPLMFVSLEPYFVTKQNLTNDINEKIDTRVLQVIYCFNKEDQRIFVGQQMDVFIETEPQQSEPQKAE